MDGDAVHRKEVFAWFGSAAYYAQCVEIELIIARLLPTHCGDNEPTAEDYQRIESEKRTIGNLVEFLHQNGKLNKEEKTLFEICTKHRNFLFHEYWYHRSSFLMTPSGCQKLVTELQEISERFKRANEKAMAISRRIRAQAGISETVVQQASNYFVKKLKQGEPEDAIIERLKQILQQYKQGKS